VSDDETLADTTGRLLRDDTPPSLIVARVALPTGSGIRMLDETAAQFPSAGCLLVSHHPRSLLMSVPGFDKYSVNFLQAEFTDSQLRSAVRRILPHGAAAR
jgi:hypothetical protein